MCSVFFPSSGDCILPSLIRHCVLGIPCWNGLSIEFGVCTQSEIHQLHVWKIINCCVHAAHHSEFRYFTVLASGTVYSKAHCAKPKTMDKWQPAQREAKKSAKPIRASDLHLARFWLEPSLLHKLASSRPQALSASCYSCGHIPDTRISCTMSRMATPAS